MSKPRSHLTREEKKTFDIWVLYKLVQQAAKPKIVFPSGGITNIGTTHQNEVIISNNTNLLKKIVP